VLKPCTHARPSACECVCVGGGGERDGEEGGWQLGRDSGGRPHRQNHGLQVPDLLHMLPPPPPLPAGPSPGAPTDMARRHGVVPSRASPSAPAGADKLPPEFRCYPASGELPARSDVKVCGMGARGGRHSLRLAWDSPGSRRVPGCWGGCRWWWNSAPLRSASCQRWSSWRWWMCRWAPGAGGGGGGCPGAQAGRGPDQATCVWREGACCSLVPGCRALYQARHAPWPQCPMATMSCRRRCRLRTPSPLPCAARPTRLRSTPSCQASRWAAARTAALHAPAGQPGCCHPDAA
jgi:hypothetical protein